MTRTPEDYAIEHAGYLATSAERLLAALGAMALREGDDEDGSQDDRDAVGDHMQAVRSAIHEFRKRAARAALKVKAP